MADAEETAEPAVLQTKASTRSSSRRSGKSRNASGKGFI